MRRALAGMALFAGFTAAAHAADLSLDSVKSAIPAYGPITWDGVTLYGTIDVGYAFIHNGAYPSGAYYHGASYSIFGSPFNHGDVSTVTNNALQHSNIGIKIDRKLGYDFAVIGRLESQFNPISGELGDACASLLHYSGRSLYDQNKNGDGNRCGQLFANAAWGGVTHPVYGTLSAGRQASLVNDGMSAYDPIAGSPAFSLLGYSSTVGASIGSSETARWNNSIKYIFTYGPFRAAGMYTNGGQETPVVENGYGASAGVTYQGFSIDGYYTRVSGAVALSRLALGNSFFLDPWGGSTGIRYTCDASLGNCPDYLLGTVTDNEAWDVMAKYTFETPGLLGEPAVSAKDAPCGGLKDAPCAPPPAKVTLYAGYQAFTQSNPDHDQSFYSGFITVGGYRYITNPYGTIVYGTDRERQTAWAGVSYQDGPWRLAAAWYYTDQNDYVAANARTLAVSSCTVSGGKYSSNCAGDFNQVSFVADYAFNKNFDVYAGVTYGEQTGGFTANALENESFAFASGVRIKW